MSTVGIRYHKREIASILKQILSNLLSNLLIILLNALLSSSFVGSVLEIIPARLSTVIPFLLLLFFITSFYQILDFLASIDFDFK